MSRRVGLWLIGAHGGVATSVVVGLAALQRQWTESCGLVSELPIFEDLNLIDWKNMVVGGHDIRQTDSLSEAKKLASGMMAAMGKAIVGAAGVVAAATSAISVSSIKAAMSFHEPACSKTSADWERAPVLVRG